MKRLIYLFGIIVFWTFLIVCLSWWTPEKPSSDRSARSMLGKSGLAVWQLHCELGGELWGFAYYASDKTQHTSLEIRGAGILIALPWMNGAFYVWCIVSITSIIVLYAKRVNQTPSQEHVRVQADLGP